MGKNYPLIERWNYLLNPHLPIPSHWHSMIQTLSTSPPVYYHGLDWSLHVQASLKLIPCCTQAFQTDLEVHTFSVTPYFLSPSLRDLPASHHFLLLHYLPNISDSILSARLVFIKHAIFIPNWMVVISLNPLPSSFFVKSYPRLISSLHGEASGDLAFASFLSFELLYDVSFEVWKYIGV